MTSIPTSLFFTQLTTAPHQQKTTTDSHSTLNQPTTKLAGYGKKRLPSIRRNSNPSQINLNNNEDLDDLYQYVPSNLMLTNNDDDDDNSRWDMGGKKWELTCWPDQEVLRRLSNTSGLIGVGCGCGVRDRDENRDESAQSESADVNVGSSSRTDFGEWGFSVDVTSFDSFGVGGEWENYRLDESLKRQKIKEKCEW